MDIESLKAFVNVAQLQSFSAAGEKLCITQPAISKRIASLESQLNTKLFDRINRSIVLTEAGTTLLPRAVSILAAIEEAKRSLHDLSGEVRGELRVATSHHIGLHKLPATLRKFSALYPEVNLKFEFLDSEIAFSRVAKGLCELAVVTLGTSGSNTLNTESAAHELKDVAIDNLLIETLWQDPLCFVTQPSTKTTQILSLAQLSLQPAILPDLSTFTGRIIKQCFEEQQLPLSVNMYTNYLETIKMLVSVGLGWSVLPQSMVDKQLKVMKVKNVSLSRNLGVIRHQQRTLSNAAQAFYALLQEDKDQSQN